MERNTSTSRTWDAVAWAAGTSIVVAAILMLVDLVARSDEAVEAISSLTLTVAAGGGLLATLAAAAMVATKHRDVAVLSMLPSLLAITTVASLFSIGILLLPLAAIAFALLVRRVGGRAGLAMPLLVGPALAVGFSILFVIWVQPPLVTCHEDGVSATSRPWWGSGASSGSGSATSGGTATGSIDAPDERYVYRCEGAELVEFRRAEPDGDAAGR